MSDKSKNGALQVDHWPWGDETIIWGFKPNHAYTLKLIEPKPGRAGCLSLQSHAQKSETWVVMRGTGWGLAIYEGKVCTQILNPGSVQTNEPGVIHRLMAVSADFRLVEASSLDAHAADKSKAKDVIRYHCFLGRECERPGDPKLAALVDKAIEYSEEACKYVEQDKLPLEHDPQHIASRIAFKL